MDASIINAIEATKSKDRNQYHFVKRTESNRLMRGARETKYKDATSWVKWAIRNPMIALVRVIHATHI